MSKQKILITCGLPYANGNAHLGHILEYLQGDVYKRALALAGEDVVFLCASDTHGAPIEVKAREAGMSPEDFVAKNSASQQRDFADFGIEFDYFYTTHSEENRRHAEFIFHALREKGQISVRPVEQYYCEHDKRFLPDRFLKGTCPFCATPDQYGDVCESCNKTYAPTELKGPYCVLCRNAPVRRSSDHYFFALGAYTDALRVWVSGGEHVQPEVGNFVLNWINEGLRDWDISRDGPYFGFKIPGEADKYFYVWLDAPVGYISTTEKFCAETGRRFDDYWRGPARIEHIIGKDIVYFHTLFWPAMLLGSGYTLPSRVNVHGMITINGEKMSKTRGNFINARTYLDHLDPQHLRYYLAANMSGSVDDLDLNWQRFQERVDGELVNNVVNLASRSLKLAAAQLDGTLGAIPEEAVPFLRELEAKVPEVIAAYRNRNFALALREILAISMKGNVYQQDKAPWQLAKTDKEAARGVITVVANVVKLVAALLKPVLPKYAADIARILGLAPLTFADAVCNLSGGTVGTFDRLIDRVDKKAIERVLEASRPAGAPAPEAAPKKKEEKKPKKAEPAPPPAEIAYDDFAKVQLVAGKIVAAERVEGADKLLKLSVDLAEGAPRTIVSGIAKVYTPEQLIGKTVAVVANLGKKPLRGIESHGMILAAGEPPVVVFLPEDVPAGASIR